MAGELEAVAGRLEGERAADHGRREVLAGVRRRDRPQAIAPLRAGGQGGLEVPGQLARVRLAGDELAVVQGFERAEGEGLPRVPGDLEADRRVAAGRAPPASTSIIRSPRPERAEQGQGRQAARECRCSSPILRHEAPSRPGRPARDSIAAGAAGSMRRSGRPSTSPIGRTLRVGSTGSWRLCGSRRSGRRTILCSFPRPRDRDDRQGGSS